MEKLLAYIKTLNKSQRDTFFANCKTTEGYIRKVASQGGVLGAAICVAIERESAGAVSRIDLRPDDFIDFWPELTQLQEAA